MFSPDYVGRKNCQNPSRREPTDGSERQLQAHAVRGFGPRSLRRHRRRAFTAPSGGVLGDGVGDRRASRLRSDGHRSAHDRVDQTARQHRGSVGMKDDYDPITDANMTQARRRSASICNTRARSRSRRRRTARSSPKAPNATAAGATAARSARRTRTTATTPRSRPAEKRTRPFASFASSTLSATAGSSGRSARRRSTRRAPTTATARSSNRCSTSSPRS